VVRSSAYYIVKREALPEQLHPQALRLSAASGHRSQIRDVIGRASAGELRRVVLELLDGDVDPCLRESRRAAYGVLLGSASASSAAMSRRATDPLVPCRET
jgi:hypothetical protein